MQYSWLKIYIIKKKKVNIKSSLTQNYTTLHYTKILNPSILPLKHHISPIIQIFKYFFSQAQLTQ